MLASKLGGTRLRECYDTAPARVKQYLNAEIHFVMDRLESGSAVLELGCGFGRVTLELAKVAGHVVGIDTSTESLRICPQERETKNQNQVRSAATNVRAISRWVHQYFSTTYVFRDRQRDGTSCGTMETVKDATHHVPREGPNARI